MALFRAFRRARPSLLAGASNPNHGNGLAFRIAAYSAAIALIACGASQNVSYGWALGSAKSETAGYILASGALAAAVMSPICLAVAFTGRGFLTRLAAAFLGLWCLAYGVTASLGFIASAKDGAISERSAVADAGADRRARFAAAAAELAALKGQTPAVLKRRRELQAVMAETATITTTKTVGAVDPQAVAIAHYLKAAGLEASPESVSTWTTAFTTAFFEIAGAFSLAVARATARAPAPAAPRRVPDAPAPAEASQRPPEPRPRDDDRDPPDGPAPPRKRGRKPTVAPAEAVDRIRRAGGAVNGSLADFGRAIGTKSRTTAHRVLHALADQGLARIATGPTGIRVALI